jgi:hypothetical protein
MKFERLQWAGHVVQTDSTRIPKKVLSGIFCGRGLWEEHVSDEKTIEGRTLCCC